MVMVRANTQSDHEAHVLANWS